MTSLIAGIITTLLVSLITLNITVTVATLLTFVSYRYLTEKTIMHIKEKKMPSILQWVDYALVFVASIMIIAGLNYTSVVTLIIAVVLYVCSLVTGFFIKKSIGSGN